jgi:plasmid maintenance system antidote protein VapI
MARSNRLSEVLREAIRRDGRSLTKLAAVADIDDGQLSRFMRGERGLTLDTTERICRALGVECRLVRRRRKGR